MGSDDRDWYREPAAAATPRRSLASWAVVVALLAVLLLLVETQWRRQGAASPTLPGEHQVRTRDVKLSLLPGLPSITLRKGSLYPKDDPWQAYLADESTCPGGERTDLPLDQQAEIMKCLVDYARASRHLASLGVSSLLSSTSAAKAARIVRCDEFSHSACGVEPSAEVREAGYLGGWGENLYVGEGQLGSPRVALDGWLNSTGHRENLFQPAWRVHGIAVVKVGRFRDYSDATLWVNQFGSD